MKTSELTGSALDWAVAKCEGITWEQGDLDAGEYGPGFKPSADWSQGGPIIEREGMHVDCLRQGEKPVWEAWPYASGTKDIQQGPTPLIAAMRCYCASKLGDTVEIPEELKP